MPWWFWPAMWLAAMGTVGAFGRAVWLAWHPGGAHEAPGGEQGELGSDPFSTLPARSMYLPSHFLPVGSMTLEDDRSAWEYHRQLSGWRAQTMTDLNPVTLASLPPLEVAHEPETSHREDAQGWDVLVCAEDSSPAARADLTGSLSSRTHEIDPVPVSTPPARPHPERTLAGRAIESSDEWLRRLTAAAGPGWTYAGTVAA